MPDMERPTVDKDRAELYLKLADQAWKRFQSRRDMEWKTAIGLWTIFGVGASAVITARDWSPGWQEVGVSSILSCLIIFIYWHLWLRELARTFTKDQMTSYFWETGVENELKEKLPAHLEPKTGDDKLDRKWVRMGESIPREAEEPKETKAKLHPVQKTQLLTTILFALLFVGAMASRAYRRQNQVTPAAARVTVEGDVGIDSITKLKVGNPKSP